MVSEGEEWGKSAGERLNNILEMGNDKSRVMLSNIVMGRNNRATRIIGFIEFGE